MAQNSKGPKHKRSISYSGSFFSSLLPSPSTQKVNLEAQLAERMGEERAAAAAAADNRGQITAGLTATTGATTVGSGSAVVATKSSHPRLAIASSLQVPLRSMAQRIYHAHQKSTPQFVTAKIETTGEAAPAYEKPEIVTPLVTSVNINTAEDCLMNYHEECKDKAPPCPKQRSRDKKPPGALLFRSSSAREKSSSVSNLTSLLSPHGVKAPIMHTMSSTSSSDSPAAPASTSAASAAAASTNMASFNWSRASAKLGLGHLIFYEQTTPAGIEDSSIKLVGYWKTCPDRQENADHPVTPSISDSYSPSMESLADEGNADDEYEDDPELQTGQEPESWSETIDKKVLKGHKAKYIQRQDNIWELIATERQYVTNLRVMQKVFAHGMRTECAIPQNAIDRIFPELDTLYDVHHTFQQALQARQDKKPDRSVDMIGDVIMDQFGGEMGEKMRQVYGKFCSRHKEGIDYYKALLKGDRKFQAFIKKTHSLQCTKRRGVPDLVTVVTMRMTKYKTLLENIIKNTKETREKPDREMLNKALDMNKDILTHIDRTIHERNQELRLFELYNKMDAKSVAVYDTKKKFKKSDLLNKRRLRHEGVLSWRNARDKEMEMLVVVLSDVIIFLQENDKKYTFFSQDSKPSVVPLTNLIVREKAGPKDNRGIYLIRQSKENPEMYELICKTAQERKDWVDILRNAVNECPEEDEGIINESETEHREVVARLAKLGEFVELLDVKDGELERLFKERFSIIADIMSVYDHGEVLQSVKSCYDDDGSLRPADELYKLALEQTSQLASLYQTVPSSTNLGRSWSSVGERHSPTYQQLPLPRRAETFNGFDQDAKPPAAVPVKTDRTDAEGRSPSLLNLSQPGDSDGEADSPMKSISSHLRGSSKIWRRGSSASISASQAGDMSSVRRAVSLRESSRPVGANRRSSSNILQQLLATGAARPDDLDSGNDSLLTLSNMAAVTAIIPPTREQAQCITQLNEYLHGLMMVVAKKENAMERLQSALAETTVKSQRIEQEQEKKSALRHNKQMEEIRNRHEQLTRERQTLESEKEALNSRLEAERQEMESLRADIEKQQNDMRREKEELQRQREALQKQIDYYQAGGGSLPAADTPASAAGLHNSSDSLAGQQTDSNAPGAPAPAISHRRTQSAELVDSLDLLLDARSSASLTEPLNMKEARAQQLAYDSSLSAKTSSTGSLNKAGSTSSLKKQNNNNTVQQQIPSKLASSTTTSSGSTSLLQKTSIPSAVKPTKNVIPMGLAESSRKVSGGSAPPGSKGSVTKKNGEVYYF